MDTYRTEIMVGDYCYTLVEEPYDDRVAVLFDDHYLIGVFDSLLDALDGAAEHAVLDCFKRIEEQENFKKRSRSKAKMEAATSK